MLPFTALLRESFEVWAFQQGQHSLWYARIGTQIEIILAEKLKPQSSHVGKAFTIACFARADKGNRTHILCLEGRQFAINPYPLMFACVSVCAYLTPCLWPVARERCCFTWPVVPTSWPCSATTNLVWEATNWHPNLNRLVGMWYLLLRLQQAEQRMGGHAICAASKGSFLVCCANWWFEGKTLAYRVTVLWVNLLLARFKPSLYQFAKGHVN